MHNYNVILSVGHNFCFKNSISNNMSHLNGIFVIVFYAYDFLPVLIYIFSPSMFLVPPKNSKGNESPGTGVRHNCKPLCSR